MDEAAVSIEFRSVEHLGGRLVFMLARCSNRSMEHDAVLRLCNARLAQTHGGVLLLKVVCFDRAHDGGAGFSPALAALDGVPWMHFAQAPLGEGFAIFIVAVAEAASTLPSGARFGKIAASGCARAVAGRVGGTTWVAACARADISGDPADAYAVVFRDAEAALSRCGGRYADLARTWTSYAGAGAPADNQPLNEFQSFNRARKHFYEAHGRTPQLATRPYCANTGLRDWSSAASMAGVGVLASDGPLRRIDIGNPLQAAPSAYASSLSVVPPLFARGYATVDGGSALVWVSGMVAVRGASVSSFEIDEQIETVSGNLEALLSKQNLAAHGIRPEQLDAMTIPYTFVALRDLSCADLVRDRLRRWLPRDAMFLFTEVSGFALPGLLVEVDCVAHFTHSGDNP